MTGRSRRAALALGFALALALSPAVAASGGTHGNHVAADTQLTDDGTVVVETVSSLTPGFVVLRADEGGRPGAPLASAQVARTPDLTFLTSVPVRIDPAVWGNWSGNRTVWAVLHDDTDGNDQFDLGTDLSMAARSPAASTRFTVRRTDSGQARVLAAAFDAQSMVDGTITVRRADLPTAGHLVVRPVGRNATIGTRSLAAGTHRNVTVALNESFVAAQRGDFRVRITAYRDDGDGSFGPADRPITADDRTVGTYLTVDPGNGTDDGPVINTPTATTAGPSDGTATATAVPTETVTTGDTPGTPTATGSTEPTVDGTADDGTAADGPGFGATAALVALLVGVVAFLARRRV